MNLITADDPIAKSADVVADNIEHLRALFPEAFAEGKVDFEVLKQLLGGEIDEGEEKYGLNWNGKRQARQMALTPSSGTLRPAPQESVHWDSTQNLMIEGDNLEVLKLLQKSYAGKVQLIYIDPPYNTGKDFVYPDNYRDTVKHYKEITGQVAGGATVTSNPETSGRYHTKWLNMLYPRIKLARDLLREEGFMFVSIDDREVARLRVLLDEVFGEDNFIANVVWQKKYTRSNDARFFSDNHDHILVYARNKDRAELGLVPRNDDQKAAYSNPDGHPKGPWKATPLHAKSGSSTDIYTFRNGVKWRPPAGTYRRYSDSTMDRLDASNEIWFGADGSATPSRKSFLSDVKSGVTPVTIWPYDEVGHTHEANSELRELLGRGVFDNPKPTRLIRRMIELGAANDDSSIVMDFFAGSGTTGHAVLAHNAERGTHHRYLLVQLPEPLTGKDDYDHITDITKERLRQAAIFIEEEHPDARIDRGYRVFKLDTSNIKAWDPDHNDIEQTLLDHLDHIRSDRSENDLLYELLLKLGLDLCVPIDKRHIAGKEVVSVGYGALFASLTERIEQDAAEELARGIVAWRDQLDPAGDTTVVFRDSSFVDDVAKANLVAVLNQHGVETVRSL